MGVTDMEPLKIVGTTAPTTTYVLEGEFNFYEVDISDYGDHVCVEQVRVLGGQPDGSVVTDSFSASDLLGLIDEWKESRQ